MKWFLIVLVEFIVVLGVSGQHSGFNDIHYPPANPVKSIKECDAKVQQADSLVNYILNKQTGEYMPSQVQQYFYDLKGNLTEVYFKNLPGRINFYHQVFEYDSNDNLIKYTNQVWKNNNWVDDLINTKTYNGAGQIVYEEFLRKNSAGVFEAYQRHFYHYQNDIITDYLRQVKNSTGQWCDFSNHFYVYDSNGRLTVLYGQYVNNGPVFWERTAIYGNDGKLTERYLRILRYNPVLKMNILTNTTYQVHSYNIYENVSEVHNSEWINDQWIHTTKDVYFYSMLKDKKVSICHNGQSLCISINALRAHLDHGDKLGTCENEEIKGNKDGKGERGSSKEKEINFFLFPNPAREQVSLRLTGECGEYKSGVILSSDGKTMFSFFINNQEELTFKISNLRNGTYIVRLYKETGFDTRTLIKK
jgi:hypothetical protein